MAPKHLIEELNPEGAPLKLNDGPIASANVQNKGTVSVLLVATSNGGIPDFEGRGYTLEPGEPIIGLVLADFFKGITDPVDLHAQCRGRYGAILIDHG